QRGIKPGDDLTLPDNRIEVRAEILDVPRHLAADLDCGHCLQCAGRPNRIDDVAGRNRRGVHLNLGPAATDVVRTRAGADGRNDQEYSDTSFHVTLRVLMQIRGALLLSTPAGAARSSYAGAGGANGCGCSSA